MTTPIDASEPVTESSPGPAPSHAAEPTPAPEAPPAVAALPAPEGPPAAPPGPVRIPFRKLPRAERMKLPRGRRLRSRRLRKAAAVFTLLLPGLAALILDLVRRGPRIFAFGATHASGYWATSAGVILLWAGLLSAASVSKRRWGRQLFAGLFTLLLGLAAGVQHTFFWKYNCYASFDSAFYSDSFPLTWVGSFPKGVAITSLVIFAVVLVAIGFLIAARTLHRPKRIYAKVIRFPAFALVIAAFSIPASYRSSIQSTAPDIIYFHGLSRYVGERANSVAYPDKATLVRVQRRFPDALPKLKAQPAAPRNILFLLQESERADHVCVEYSKDCDRPARSHNALVPNRFPFLQMRSAASSTAVAISNLWTGVDPTSSYEVLHKAPVLWEYALAAGYDTAYWTSQNLIFGNARLYVQDIGANHFASGTNIDPRCDTLIGALDSQVSQYAIDHWDELKEPFFAVVHYSNLHRPRYVDKKKSPYQPSADKHTRREEGKNHYKNAVYLSDMAVAKLIEHVRGTEAGKRTVIVYTSDHAEALYEHFNENDHSATVFDEEVHIPAWIDGPEGTLSAAEKQAMTGKKNTFLVQYDIAATILDLLGVWDLPEIASQRSLVIGQPLTRPEQFDKPRPLTNISWVWEYHLPNWGMILGSKKVVARPEDKTYLCYDLVTDPGENKTLGEAACPALVAAAKERFKILPRDIPHHMRSRPDIFGPWPPRPAP